MGHQTTAIRVDLGLRVGPGGGRGLGGPLGVGVERLCPCARVREAHQSPHTWGSFRKGVSCAPGLEPGPPVMNREDPRRG